jgi:hypothetical protein
VIIELIRRECPGVDICVSNINTLGGNTEVVITAAADFLLTNQAIQRVEEIISTKFDALRDLLRSSDARVLRLNRKMDSNLKELRGLIQMSDKGSLTFNAPVTAGVIGHGTVVTGGIELRSPELISVADLQAALESLRELSAGLNSPEKDQIIQIINNVEIKKDGLTKGVLGSVEIQDSSLGLFMIQALNGAIRSD